MATVPTRLGERKRRTTAAPTVPPRVLRSLRIRRFRHIRDLVLDELAPVTILTGRNGSGKTTVLEAAFLLCGLSNASLVFSLAGLRGLVVVPGVDTAFRILFPDLDESQSACIEGETDLHQGDGRLALELTGITAVVGAEPTTEPKARLVGVELRARSQSGERKGFVKWERPPVGPPAPVLEFGPVRLESAPGLRIETPENPDILSARYVRPQPHAILVELHSQLTELVKTRSIDRVVDLLRVVAPQVVTLHPLVEFGQPVVYVDVGRARLFPVQILGGGFINVLQLATFMYEDASRILLIDEIEDGLHYSVVPNLAKAILAFAAERKKQFIIATHSRDVLSAFGAAASETPELLTFVKLFRKDGVTQSERFSVAEWSDIEEIGGEIR